MSLSNFKFVCIYVSTFACNSECMHVRMYVCMHVCVYVSLCLCIHVCMFVFSKSVCHCFCMQFCMNNLM